MMACRTVTIFTLPDEARIFGINHVGLVGTCLVAGTADEYEAMLERLIVDDAFRIEKGRGRTSSDRAASCPPGCALQPGGSLRARQEPPCAREQCCCHKRYRRTTLAVGSPDDIHQDIVGAEPLLSEIKMTIWAPCPSRQRIAQWSRMQAGGNCRPGRDASTPAA